MNVLLVTSHLEIGGIPRYVSALACALLQRGHDVTVASGGGVLVGEVEAAGVRHLEVPLRTKSILHPRVLWAARSLATWVRSHGVDVIHAHTRVAHVAAHLAAGRAGVPYVVTHHGMYRRRLGRRVLPCLGARVIAISRPVYDHLERTFQMPPGRLALVPNGIDLGRFPSHVDADRVQAFRLRVGVPSGRTVVGTVSRLVEVKGVAELVRAFQLVAGRDSTADLLIVGEGGERRALERQVQRAALQHRVHFAGAVLDVEVVLSTMEVCVFPVVYEEPFGLSVLEAMAMRRPVVASRAGAIPDVVEAGRTGLLVPPRDANALASAVVSLLCDPDRRRAMGEAGRQRVEERFTMDRVAQDMDRIYQDVTTSRPERAM